MANYELIPGTTANSAFSASGGYTRRSTIKNLRLGEKRVKLFVVAPASTTVSETITVKNGRKGEIWPLNNAGCDLSDIAVTQATSGKNTVYSLAGTAAAWVSGKSCIFAVEIGGN